MESIAYGVPVVPTSTLTGVGLDAVSGYLPTGVTGALLGSSGVGKSTLVNALVGEELLFTQEIRDDGRGRHTTTRRELIVLPGGWHDRRYARHARAAALGRGRRA